jgi:xanthine dehydrogenase accessory factor
MNTKILKEIIKKKLSREDFAVLTNLSTSKSQIFDSKKLLSKEFENYENEINNYYNLKKNGVIDGTEIFILNYIRPIEVIIVGAVHIAQYLIDLLKNFNFLVTIIDPRKYFTNEQRFKNVKIINEWPNNALEKIETSSNFALITLTHDPKIDDPALNYALKNKFFYIGALGSKKTHENRCKRLKEAGFDEKAIGSIHGPIGIKFGGKSTPEIALSIVAQLVSETNKLLLNSKN